MSADPNVARCLDHEPCDDFVIPEEGGVVPNADEDEDAADECTLEAAPP